MLKRKSRLRTVVTSLVIYFLLLVNIIVYVNLSDNSKIHIEKLGLVGKTVNQTEEILASEGYKQKDYILITTDGSEPGKDWKIEKVEDADKARIFIQETELPNLKDMNLIESKWNVALAKLQKAGYTEEKDYQLIYEGTIWNPSAWNVSKIKEYDGEIPKITIEKIPVIITTKEFEKVGEESINQNLGQVVKMLTNKDWTEKNFTFKSHRNDEIILIPENWVIQTYEIKDSVLIFTARKKLI